MLRPRFIAYRTVAAVTIIIIAIASYVALVHVSSPEHRVRTIVGANAIVYDWQMANIAQGLPANDAPSYWGINLMPRIGLHYPGQIVAIDLKFSEKPLDRNLVDAISQLQALRVVAVDCTRATEADRNYLRLRAHGRFEVLGSCE